MNRVDLEKLADRLLLLIRTRPGARFRLDHVADELSAHRDDLPRAAEQLRTWGYTLNLTESDIRLLATPDSLTATELTWGLDTRFIGKRLLAFNQVKSTNDIAAREAESGAPEGTVVIADQQIFGRGRLGRVWHSPPGTGAYISIILRPSFLPDRAPGLSLMTALALTRAIEITENIEVKIKWPNDIMLNGRKTAGILTELSADRNKIYYVVVGIGINTNQTETDFPDELRDLATSIRIASGHEISRVALVQTFFREFEREYQLYCQDFLAPSLSRLRRYSSLIGQPVRLDTGHGIIEGRAVDIDTNGSLILEQESPELEQEGSKHGRRLTISAGDVSVVKK